MESPAQAPRVGDWTRHRKTFRRPLLSPTHPEGARCPRDDRAPQRVSRERPPEPAVSGGPPTSNQKSEQLAGVQPAYLDRWRRHHRRPLVYVQLLTTAFPDRFNEELEPRLGVPP